MKDIIDKRENTPKEKNQKERTILQVNTNKDTGKEKIKVFLKKIKPFCKENKRYLMVAVLFVCFTIMMVFFTGEAFNADRIAQSNSKPISGDKYVPDAEFEVDAYEDVNSLITEYFEAYIAADVEALAQMAIPMSEMEKSYITTMSPFYEEYQNITCYTKQGLSKDSYIVSVCFDIKFVDIEETAPSMVLFYVQTDKEGSLYINNLYSDFNMMYAEKQLDKDVYTAIRKYTLQDDYIKLVNKVNEAYAKLIKENNEIYQISKRIIPGTRQIWEDTVYYAKGTESTEDTQGTQSTESTQKPPTSEQKPPTSEQTPPTSEQTPPTSEQTPPTSEQKPPTSEQKPPTSEQKPPTSEQTPPTSEQTPPTSEQTPPEPEKPVVHKIKIVNVRVNVNIRQKPDADSKDIGDAENGDVFVKLGEETNSKGEKWIKVRFGNNKVGYIKANYTKDITE